MNEGQFKAMMEVLTRIAECLENQRPLIIAVPGDANVAQIMEELNKVRAPKATVIPPENPSDPKRRKVRS